MTGRIAVALATLGVIAAVVTASTGFSHPTVADLGKDFNEKIAEPGKVNFIKFYAPWCGHCKKLAPAWGELADAFAKDDKVVIGHVDCTVHKDACADVRGYPTLKVYSSGEEQGVYRGARDVAALSEFVNQKKAELLEETKA
ncbi:hypothetical protein WJX72_001505 [[Myrmecia] bisecta]|uniref:Thioredoxin domain-containing protein n=1 Tax=[Myrmecia] bisecta TaxID=41462 RepID=A0AAW1PN33_9CHLO